ncbi:bifunctional (p)ppGpp synthetase/guanosine-3',5'-bis(diphosphate) 3'-pyrophosphohydrolase [Candidatus Peregrinibacteria bacterium]|jgi:GTP diphosphokinase / guanosine-3',5'-bis(diphosphate) 3'-diphosphatase|nr:bifunctional (p)ppGpp synthetase/guanosine-3',5'-bis(diphosphate) 3'-pyrophosphohydrolase [Candidatus Peregrinibacteria bacterium]
MAPGQIYKSLKQELEKYLRPFDSKLLDQAYEFAKEAHEGQKRKSGEPYIIHPISAALILAKMRVDLPTVITCILHDVPEDTDRTLDDIEEHFGSQIAELVAGITKLSAVHYQHNMQDRQIDTLRRMFLVMAKDIRVVLVKLADRLHNMRTLEYVRPEKATRIAKETLEIYSPLANLLGVWGLRQEMDDLCFKYIHTEQYNKIKSVVDLHREKQSNYISKIKRKTKKLIEEEKLEATVEGRWKHLFSIYKKMKRNKKQVPQLYDLPVIRIVVDSVENCYKVIGMVHSKWNPKPNQFRDYIAVAKPNGYQSLHTTVFGPDSELIEFQVRTKDMDLKSKYGIASQFIYGRRGRSANINTFLEGTPWVQKVMKLQSKSNVDFIEDLKLNVLSDRVFIFTPDGDVIDMPQGSSPLDFAYRLSADKGNRYAYAVVNKEKKPMSYELQTGDVIEIHTDKNIKPNREWLYFVITDEAKEGIKKVFKKRSRTQRKDLGEMIFDNISFAMQKGNFRNLSMKRKMKVVDLFKCKDLEELLLMVGSGEIAEKKVTQILVQNQEEIFTSNGFSIEKLFKMFFKNERYDRLRARLILELDSRVGLVSDISEVLAHEGINIIRLEAKEAPFYRNGMAVGYINIEVEDLNQVKRAIRSLEGINGVKKVKQSRALGWGAFYSAMAIAVIAWLAHPLVVSEFARELIQNDEVFLKFFWISGLLFILLMLYLRRFAITHLPKAIGRHRFIIFMNFTIVLVIGTLLMESPLFEVDFSFFIFGPTILAIMAAGFLRSK